MRPPSGSNNIIKEGRTVNLKKPSQIIFLALAAAAMLAVAPAALRAESNVPITDLGAFGVLVDPTASGTKLSSAVTFAYDYETTTPRALACLSGRWVSNLHVIATVQKGNEIRPFSSNYSFAGFDNLQACFEHQDNQLTFFKFFIDRVVIPGFYNCVPGGCPPYAVKSIKNFLTTGVGGASLEVELAVK
jgi:hypothetical protein